MKAVSFSFGCLLPQFKKVGTLSTDLVHMFLKYGFCPPLETSKDIKGNSFFLYLASLVFCAKFKKGVILQDL